MCNGKDVLGVGTDCAKGTALDAMVASAQQGKQTMTEETKAATEFGADVFGDEAIKTYLSKDTAK